MDGAEATHNRLYSRTALRLLAARRVWAAAAGVSVTAAGGI